MQFQNLQYLRINGLFCFKEISLLIEKTKGNLSQIYIGITDEITTSIVEHSEMLIKAIANNCPKIERLHTYLEPKDFIYVQLLLLNCRNLKSIRFDSWDPFVNANDNTGDGYFN